MSDPLPGGAAIPVTFAAGQPLTENELNTLQRELLRLILTHTHGGNDLSAPQGVPITREGIAKDAVTGTHIVDNAITRGHISHGAVGASEIGQRQVGPEHLADSAVVTRSIAKANVTLEKLSADVVALLNAPREGATTYGYFAWLDGRIAFPGTSVWYDWLVDANKPVRAHDLPILRMRDDGGWQPIEVILPPEQLRPHLGDIIRTEAGPMISEAVSDRSETARSEIAADAVAESNLSSVTRDVRSRAIATTPFDRVGTPIDVRIPPPISIITQPIKRVIVDPRFRVPIHIDTPVGINTVPTDDLVERNRVAMELDPQTIGWDAGVDGATVFHPGTGSNMVFNNANEPVTFQPDRTPSNQELETINAMLYHYDIADFTAQRLLAVGRTKIYDFLNSPHLMPAGYWTGASQNVRAVVRMLQNDREIVRVKFNVPYVSANYVVHVTPELDRRRNMGFFPLVIQRAKEYVDIGFMSNQNALDNKVNFNVTIHGELAES